MSGQTICIGIDLGTQNSRMCAILRCGEGKVIRNDHGNLSTPSCVAFTDDGTLIGDKAKEKRNMDQRNKVFSVKRVLGLSYADLLLAKCKQSWPFDVLNSCGKPKIKINTKERENSYFPEEIGALILTEMKKAAEAKLGEKVTGVVITVPTYFKDSQRQATVHAGEIAGLNVLGIINAPTAAAIAFSYRAKVKEERHVMIIDFGGGGFDVSILKVREGYFEVQTSSGSPHLNGEHLDNLLLTYYVDEIEGNYGVDISTNVRAMSRLRNACEDAKMTLSSDTRVNEIVDGLVDGKDFLLSLSRRLFDEICGPTIRDAVRHIDNVLRDAKLSKDEIDDICLLGGCGRIRLIQNLLREHLGKTPQVIEHEDVLYGAAIHAARLSRQWQLYSLLDVIPLSLTIEIPDKNVTVNLIEKNQRIPTRIEHTFTTIYDNQQELLFNIFEEGREDLESKEILGRCSLTGIPAATQGEPQIRVTFEINLNGILHVLDATERNTGKKLETKLDKGYKTNEDIQKLVAKVETLSNEVTAEKLRIIAKDGVERYAYSARQAVRQGKYTIPEGEINHIRCLSHNTLEWLEKNQMTSKETFDSQLENMKALCESTMIKLHEDGKLLPRDRFVLGFSAKTKPITEDVECDSADNEPRAHGSAAVAIPKFEAA